MSKKYIVAYSSSIIILVCTLWLGVSIGSVQIPISTLWDSESNPTAYNIL